MSKKIVFDLGAVLVRWEPLLLLQEVFSSKAPDEIRVRQWAADIFRGFEPGSEWALFDKGMLEVEEVAEKISARTEFSADEITRLILAIPAHLTLLQKTVDLIEVLKGNGYQLYFLSNMPSPFARYLVDTYDFKHWFIDGIFSADVQEVKPEPEIFHIAARRWQLDQAIFIDDSAKNIATALALGWRAIQFQSIEQVNNALSEMGVRLGNDAVNITPNLATNSAINPT